MAKRKPQLKPIQDDEISLFDGMMRSVTGMPKEAKERLTQTFLLLMACAEDDRLNMDKLGLLVGKLSDGKFSFGREASGPNIPAEAGLVSGPLGDHICGYLTSFYDKKNVGEFRAYAKENGVSLEQVAAAGLAMHILQRFRVTPLEEANGQISGH